MRGRVRMAYSFNGTQPVLCTLLCDQPLYYMEEEIFEEEEAGLFAEEERMINAALHGDMGGAQKKISVYDSIAKKFEAAPDARLQAFAENAQSFGSRTLSVALSDVIDMLTKSRFGQSLIDHAYAHGVQIAMSDQVRDAAFDAAANIILFNPAQAEGDAVLTLASALRAAAQVTAGAGHHPLSYHPDEAILVNRAQAADVAVAQVRLAWELQLAEIQAPWARLEQSQGCDLARSFAREALCDFRALNSGKAAQAAFESWFLSDRCKVEDRGLIQAMLADQDARHYETPTQALGPAFFAALGEQTLGNNYLGSMAGTLLSDPLFSDVRDRANANFLWFVKFERSFKETEEELAQETPETIHNIAAPLEDASNQSNIVYVSFGGMRRSS